MGFTEGDAEYLQVSACQLIELGIQNCCGSADNHIEGISSISMRRLSQPTEGKALPTVLLNVVSI